MTYLGPKERQALRVLLSLEPAGTAEKQAAQKALLPLLTPPLPKEPVEPLRLDVSAGDYRLVQGAAGELVAYRHGELWRDLTGDQLACALGHRIEELENLLRGGMSDLFEVAANVLTNSTLPGARQKTQSVHDWLRRVREAVREGVR